MKSKNNIIKTFLIFGLVFMGFLFLFLRPANAATFTVDSTGDGADAATDGLCATAGGVCTLRAAIAEANAAVGPHTIGFSINTTDGGYVDFDGGAGDGTGGDDYWLITPATVLPTITSSSVTINGAIQTTNWGDKNTSGPEIMLDGHTGGEINGLVFNGTNGTVNGLTLYRFGSAVAAIEVTADGFTLTNSYIGTTANGLTGASGSDRSLYGIHMNGASGTIGTTTSNGNVISGNSNYAIKASCGTTGGETVNIAGNKIGLGSDGTTAIANIGGIYLLDECISLIGGNLEANRNYIASNTVHLNVGSNASSVGMVEVYNNFFGTDVTGTLDRGSTNISITFSNAIYSNPQPQIIIGAQGKGNLIRFAKGTTINVGLGKSFYVGYNTISDSVGVVVLFPNNGGSHITFNTTIEFNYLGAFTSDPYFLKNTGLNSATAINFAGGHKSAGIQILNNKINCSPSSANGIGAGTVKDMLIANNEIYNCQHGIIYNGQDSIIQNNLIYNNERAGIGIRTPQISLANNRAKLLGNISYGNNTGGGGYLDIEVGDYVSFTTANPPGPNVNDAGDVDTGPNEKMNWPEIQEIEYLGAGEYTISGRLDGNTAEDPFTVEICESSKHALGYGGCIDSLGTTTTASTPDEIDGSSNYYNWSMNVQTQYSYKPGNISFTGLATSVLNASSEFGANYTCTDNIACPIVAYPVVNLVGPINSETVTDGTPLLDWDPSEDEDGNLNPEVDHYDVILDNVVIASVDDSATQFQTTVVLANGSHTWQVLAYRAGDELIGTSAEEDFSVLVEYTDLPLVYPINGVKIDDRTPQFDWDPLQSEDGDTNPDLSGYSLIVDGEEIAELDEDQTEYQVPAGEELSLTNHTWQVIAEGSETWESEEETFTITKPTYSFQPVYPVNVIIDDQMPLFDWTNLPENSIANTFSLHIDGEQFASISTDKSYYQIDGNLSQGEHTWFVIAYFQDVDDELVEVGRTSTAKFEIALPKETEEPEKPEEPEPPPIKPPVTGEKPNKDNPPKDILGFIKEFGEVLGSSIQNAYKFMTASKERIILFTSVPLVGLCLIVFGRKKKYQRKLEDPVELP